MGSKEIQALKYVMTLTLTIAFVAMSRDEILRYNLHPTATSTHLSNEKEIELPALTICDNHFRYADMLEELGFPRAPFGKPAAVNTDPSYSQLFRLGVNLTSLIWTYYFSFREIVHLCTAGGVGCSHVDIEGSAKNHDQWYWEGAARVLEVPAGRWISRPLFDAVEGQYFMCHSLVPNVSVSFAVQGGNVIALSWKKQFVDLSTYWDVYIHDKHEHVLLTSYAIANLPKVTISRHKETGKKKKITIFPEVRNNPATAHHPCNSSSDYSYNLCQLESCWRKRFSRIRERYGALFQCQLPGILLGPNEPNLPICNHFMMEPNSVNHMGAFDLLSENNLRRLNLTHGRKKLDLVSPMLGTELPTSCLERCQRNVFNLVHDDANEKDRAIYLYDFYLYFPSSEVEHWTKYESYGILTLVSNIGGMLGLFLGASILSLSSSIIGTAREMFFFSCRRSE